METGISLQLEYIEARMRECVVGLKSEAALARWQVVSQCRGAPPAKPGFQGAEAGGLGRSRSGACLHSSCTGSSAVESAEVQTDSWFSEAALGKLQVTPVWLAAKQGHALATIFRHARGSFIDAAFCTA